MFALSEKQRAQEYMATYKPNLIGVTGASGKTAVVQAIAEAVSAMHLVRAATPEGSQPQHMAAGILGNSHKQKRLWFKMLFGSQANEIKQAEPKTIVVECNAGAPGDIGRISTAFQFTHAVVLNTGTIHADLFPTKESVAHEFTALAASLPKHGVAILNIDDPAIAANRPRLLCHHVTFGTHPQADVRLMRADRISLKGFIGQLAVMGKPYECSVQHLVGRHQLDAILAAIAVVHSLGGDIPQAIEALRNLPLPPGRMNIVEGNHKSTIIDDSHGATPESMQAALKTLAALPADLPGGEISPRRIAILGDIGNLGAQSIRVHQSVGEAAARTCQVFIGVGKAMKQAQAAALQKGGVDTHHFETSEDVGKWLKDYLQPGDIVLIKGGSEMHMGKVVESLKA
ncbi:MAG: hypothetical protein HYZ63_03215 [Candidatus Andersenbacteria bacterium]|nr:hypothetical protein [Candidatus Andersenbacteria bacterium]